MSRLPKPLVTRHWNSTSSILSKGPHPYFSGKLFPLRALSLNSRLCVGNRFVNSLGSVEAMPLASLTFINFATGQACWRRSRRPYAPPKGFNHNNNDWLHLCPRCSSSSPGSKRSCCEKPVQSTRKIPHRRSVSSFHPLLRKHLVLLTKPDLLSQDLPAFRFGIQGTAVEIAGQTVMLDFTGFVGFKQYAHMNPRKRTLGLFPHPKHAFLTYILWQGTGVALSSKC